LRTPCDRGGVWCRAAREAKQTWEEPDMSIDRRQFFAAMVFSASVLAAGWPAAAADPVVPLPADAKAQLDKYLGPGVVGDAIASPPLLSADGYLPPKGTAITYRVIEEGEKPRTETHKVADTTNPKFKPGWRYSVDPVGAMYFQPAADGGATIVGEEDLDNKVLSRFTPGQPLMIPGLKAGESRQVAVNVQVSDLKKPDKITHKGNLTITYTYVGSYKVTVPAGSFDAQLIKWDYQGEVGPADIKQTDFRFIAPHAGMVAMIQSKHISAMLIYNDKTKLGKLLQASK
jgi:hypothetical protein